MYDEDKSGTISRDELTKVLVHTRRNSHTNLPPLTHSPTAAIGGHLSRPVQAAGPVIVRHDDGEHADVIMDHIEDGHHHGHHDHMEEGGYERMDPRFMEMDPAAYELAEGIAELFESMDTNGDNQISMEEFMVGASRHPELVALFFPTGVQVDASTEPAPMEEARTDSVS